MSGRASFSLRGRNPDVLTCIANLSNDRALCASPALQGWGQSKAFALKAQRWYNNNREYAKRFDE